MIRIIARSTGVLLAVLLIATGSGYGGFELGWHWRGDDIYGGAYKAAYEGPAMTELQERISPKKESARAGLPR